MGRLRGVLWLTAGLVVAVLAAVVGYMLVSQEPEPSPRRDVPVVVAARNIDVRSRLTAEDLEVIQVPVETRPETAVRNLERAVGKVTTVDLFPGEIILTTRLLDPNVISRDGRHALIISEDEEEVLMAFPAQDLLNQVGILKAGDHVDILFSFDFPVGVVLGGGVPLGGEGEEQVTFSLLQDLTIAAIVTEGDGGGAQAILLTVSPQDALALKFMKDAGGTPDFVLRAPGVEQLFDTEPVDIDYLIDRYLIPVEIGP